MIILKWIKGKTNVQDSLQSQGILLSSVFFLSLSLSFLLSLSLNQLLEVMFPFLFYTFSNVDFDTRNYTIYPHWKELLFNNDFFSKIDLILENQNYLHR